VLPTVYYLSTRPILNTQDDFVVVATDGVWDVMTNEDVADAVLKTARDPGLAAKRIGGDALTRGSRDNISVVVVFLKDLSEDFRRG
jgi:serine/threonine protein phosphatase PrpC